MQPRSILSVLSCAFLCLLGPFTAVAQTMIPHDFKQPRPFLYRIEKNGKVSHILVDQDPNS